MEFIYAAFHRMEIKLKIIDFSKAKQSGSLRKRSKRNVNHTAAQLIRSHMCKCEFRLILIHTYMYIYICIFIVSAGGIEPVYLLPLFSHSQRSIPPNFWFQINSPAYYPHHKSDGNNNNASTFTVAVLSI